MYEHGTPWTDWSLSDVDVTTARIWDINAAFEFVRWRGLAARIMLGYKQNFWEWEDRGVFHVYSTDPSSTAGFRDDVGSDPSVK